MSLLIVRHFELFKYRLPDPWLLRAPHLLVRFQSSAMYYRVLFCLFECLFVSGQ